VKVVATAVAYIVSLAVTAAVSFFAVLVLAGPHAGLLPSWLEPAVLGIGWLVVLVVPVIVARVAWRRIGRSQRPNHSRH
jgi:hypothetical protein